MRFRLKIQNNSRSKTQTTKISLFSERNMVKIVTAGSEKWNPRAKRHSGQRERKDSARTGDTSFAWRLSSCFWMNPWWCFRIIPWWCDFRSIWTTNWRATLQIWRRGWWEDIKMKLNQFIFLAEKIWKWNGNDSIF